MWGGGGGGGEEGEGEGQRVGVRVLLHSPCISFTARIHLVSGADMPAIFNLYHPEE